ncbi:hypothetical protein [Porphyromonas cangingivalis]|uniref:hypothetical protein n=1 Tax=Porphyromonas cangingivalis TaxID=36874 RepID=UPI000F822853|nr:hypothetical protein [Porphyromonas cangingivalis]
MVRFKSNFRALRSDFVISLTDRWQAESPTPEIVHIARKAFRTIRSVVLLSGWIGDLVLSLET